MRTARAAGRRQRLIDAFWRHVWAAGYATLLLVVLVVSLTRVLTLPDLVLLDSQYKLLAAHAPKPVARPVVVVGIDDETIRRFPEPLALWHPYLGQFLKAMAAGQAAVVGFDVYFPDRSYDQIVAGYDLQLLQGLVATRAASKVVLGVTVDAGGKPLPIYAPFVSVAGRDSRGYVMLYRDADDIARSARELVVHSEHELHSLVGQMVHKMGLPAQLGMIDYALGPQARYIPLHQVVQWLQDGDVARLKAEFAGRPVLLGGVRRYEDRHFQPINLAGWESASENGLSVPGVLIHAQILKSILNGGLIAPLPPALVLLLALAATAFWRVPLRPARMLLVLALVLAALYLAGLVLLYHGVYVALGAVMVGAAGGLLGRSVIDSVLQMRERRRLRRAFAGYVSPQMMDEILAGRLADELVGEMRTVCILFADVRGFTTFSESMSPQAVLALLNRYYEQVVGAIHAEGGTISCIMGDGIMAIFGAPKTIANPVAPAYAAARKIFELMPALNRTLQSEGKAPLTIGIGLNVGDAIVGHVGAQVRHDYSAIGDTINVAARLESLTKEVGCPLLCSKAVSEALGPESGLRSLGVRAIKGRSPMEVFGWDEVAGVAGPAVAAQPAPGGAAPR